MYIKKSLLFILLLVFPLLAMAQSAGGQIRRPNRVRQDHSNTPSNNRQSATNQHNRGTVQPIRSLPTGKVNGYDAIDLGLSVRWASCNVGATRPEDFGSFFAYGDPTGEKFVEDKKEYPDVSITNTDLDMAKSNWGDGWRLPTKKELKELMDKCKWQYVEDNGIRGYKIIGSNGNEIFLPFAGQTLDGHIRIDEKYGYYRSGDIKSKKSDILILYITGNLLRNDPFINNGYSVRAVTD